MKDVSVDQVMTTTVISANTNQQVSVIAQIFGAHKFHHIPIIDDDQCLRGIISRIDFERIKYGATLFRNPKIDEYNEVLFQSLLTKNIMTEGVVHLHPKDTIHKAFKLFKNNQFRALPVVAKGTLVGIVTPLDILDYYFQSETN